MSTNVESGATAFACRICGNTASNTEYLLREMMYGTGESFPYVECGRCGCLQIAAVPADLGAYYPPGYYSYSMPRQAAARVRRFLKSRRGVAAFQGKGALGRALLRALGPPSIATALAPLSPALDARILDVGAGNGRLLLELADCGFRNLTGVDPFIARTIEHPQGVRVLKQTLREADPGYDLVMFNHSFEHLPAQHETLRDVRRILRPGGAALVRVPVTGTHAWRTFGAHWIQLDPPRHLYLHTPRSIGLLAADCGFDLFDVRFDSDELQFWGSLQAERGVPLQSERSYANDPRGSGFSRAEIRAFRRQAASLNAQADGDQACFYLRVAGDARIRAADSSRSAS